MLSTRYSLHLHIKRAPKGPRFHEIQWAAVSTAWSRISTGNAPVKTIGATVPICNPWTFSESAIDELLEIVSNVSDALPFFGTWYVIYCSFGRPVLILFWFSVEDHHWLGSNGFTWGSMQYPVLLSFCRFELPWFDIQKTVLWAGTSVTSTCTRGCNSLE